MSSLYDFSARTLRGEDKPLADYAGKVVLVVNTASKCGLTPQFTELEELNQRYREQGLEVIGFPCNQFAGQEPGDADAISDVCHVNYGVTFDMFDKIDVNGSDAHPLFVWLRSQKGGFLGSSIKWNFAKFLVGRDGQVIERYAPTVKPSEIAADIEAALAA
jgi:glutathione peroxidase